MTNFKKSCLSLAVATALSFSGCGDSSAPKTQIDNEDDNTNNSIISGKIADGYLDKAKVCLDKNKNGKCDTAEPNTLSINGNYDLNITTTDMGKYLILVEVTTSTVDLDNNQTVTNGYTLTAPKNSTEFISPITTLIQNEILKNPILTKDEATSKVSQKLNLTTSDTKLLADYVANNSDSEYSKLHEVGKVIATLQGTLELKTTQEVVLTNDNKKATMSKILDNIYNDINNTSSQIKNGTLAGAIDTDSISSNINITSDDVSIAAKNLEFKQSGAIDKMSLATKVTLFGFDADTNHNSINDVEIEAAIFKDGQILMGRDSLSNGVSAITTSIDNITNTPDTENYTINDDGSIFVSEWDETFVRFSTIKLKDKTYTVKEIIRLMSDGYSIKESDVTSKLNNNVTFTDDSDKFYMYVTTNHGKYSSTGYKLSESAMRKVITALQ